MERNTSRGEFFALISISFFVIFSLTFHAYD